MNIKNKILSLAGVGAVLSQFFVSRVLADDATEEWKSWLPDFGKFKDLDLQGVVKMVIQFALILAGLMAVIFIIWGGYQYITSSGDAEKATKGRATLINAIIGLVIIFLAYAIVGYVYSQIDINPKS